MEKKNIQTIACALCVTVLKKLLITFFFEHFRRSDRSSKTCLYSIHKPVPNEIICEIYV